MEISPLFLNFNPPKQNELAKSHQRKFNTTFSVLPLYPKNYQPYFGARLNRTPENFYAQEFNMQNMPVTVREFLLNDIENNRQKRPMQLQQEAFFWLQHCITTQEIKDMYPSEDLFRELKTLDEVRPKHGYLLDLRMALKDNPSKATSVLKSKQDLTAYLVNKIFIEGKDLQEINEDFKKDVDEKFLMPQKYDAKGYFQYSTLASLGISFPKTSYWFSLQATRQDKEYIPTTRTFDPAKERKKRVYTLRPPRILTPEEKQKRSLRMINRWLSLSPAQQANQIEKMRAGLGEKGNILFDYLSPIMIIATEHIKLSDKLVEFYKQSGIECPIDISNLSKEQGTKLQKFWDENPKLKESFSQAISKTIKLYETAQMLGPRYIAKLNSIANLIKAKNELKARQRKLTSEEAIRAYMTESIMSTIGLYYRPYAQKYLDFVLKHSLYRENFSRAYTQNIFDNLQHNEQYEDKMSKIMNTIHKEFVKNNLRETIAVNTAVAEILFRQTKDPLLFSANNTQLLLSTIVKNNLEGYVISCAEEIDQMVKEYTTGFSDEELKNVYQTITGIMGSVSKLGYLTLADVNVRKRASNLPKVLKNLDKDKKVRRQFRDFLRQYEAQIKFSKKTTTSESVRFYMFESIIDDYLISLGY